jgi:hypothetical protein
MLVVVRSGKAAASGSPVELTGKDVVTAFDLSGGNPSAEYSVPKGDFQLYALVYPSPLNSLGLGSGMLSLADFTLGVASNGARTSTGTAPLPRELAAPAKLLHYDSSATPAQWTPEEVTLLVTVHINPAIDTNPALACCPTYQVPTSSTVIAVPECKPGMCMDVPPPPIVIDLGNGTALVGAPGRQLFRVRSDRAQPLSDVVPDSPLITDLVAWATSGPPGPGTTALAGYTDGTRIVLMDGNGAIRRSDNHFSAESTPSPQVPSGRFGSASLQGPPNSMDGLLYASSDGQLEQYAGGRWSNLALNPLVTSDEVIDERVVASPKGLLAFFLTGGGQPLYWMHDAQMDSLSVFAGEHPTAAVAIAGLGVVAATQQDVDQQLASYASHLAVVGSTALKFPTDHEIRAIASADGGIIVGDIAGQLTMVLPARTCALGTLDGIPKAIVPIHGSPGVVSGLVVVTNNRIADMQTLSTPWRVAFLSRMPSTCP